MYLFFNQHLVSDTESGWELFFKGLRIPVFSRVSEISIGLPRLLSYFHLKTALERQTIKLQVVGTSVSH